MLKIVCEVPLESGSKVASRFLYNKITKNYLTALSLGISNVNPLSAKKSLSQK